MLMDVPIVGPRLLLHDPESGDGGSEKAGKTVGGSGADRYGCLRRVGDGFNGSGRSWGDLVTGSWIAPLVEGPGSKRQCGHNDFHV